MFLSAQSTTMKDTLNGQLFVDSSRLGFVVVGEGMPCLVLGSSVYYLKTFSLELRKHLRMYFVDLKWFAAAHHPEDLSKVNIASIVEDVEVGSN